MRRTPFSSDLLQGNNHKVQAWSRLGSLVLGLACGVMVFLLLYENLRHLQFQTSAARMVDAVSEGRRDNATWSKTLRPRLVEQAQRAETPRMQEIVRRLRMHQPLVLYLSQRFIEPQGYYADAAVFL